MFWRELLRTLRGQLVPPTSAETYTLAATQSACHLQVICTDIQALHTGQPCYLADLIELYRPSRVLRSSNSHLLAVPSCSK